jgi:thiol-disulfide isomerase/thioredoxin
MLEKPGMFMRKSVIFVCSLLIFMFLPVHVHGQKIEKIKIPELEKILKNPDNKLFVVNFWATWCAPCVKELPFFEEVSKDYDPEIVRFMLISLDFPGEIEKQLIPFLKKNDITLNVSVMMESDYNAWIDKVDSSWQGNIPATLIFNNNKNQRIFFPGELDQSGLRKMINSLL